MRFRFRIGNLVWLFAIFTLCGFWWADRRARNERLELSRSQVSALERELEAVNRQYPAVPILSHMYPAPPPPGYGLDGKHLVLGDFGQAPLPAFSSQPSNNIRLLYIPQWIYCPADL